MQKSEILSNLKMPIAFHKAFIFPHFKFLHLSDPKTGGTLSFLSPHCVIRYYLMCKDLELVKGENWKQHDEFSDFLIHLSSLNSQEQAQQKQKITFFFKYMSNSIMKHFEQWTKSHEFWGLFVDTFCKIVCNTCDGC